MLTVVLTVKLIAEIALMALLGQWALGVLAGAKRDKNLFYQVLRAVGSPFVALARRMSPRFVLAQHAPLVAFLLLAFLWLGATLLKIRICLRAGLEVCR